MIHPMDLLAELTRLNPDPALLDGVKKLLGDAQDKDLTTEQRNLFDDDTDQDLAAIEVELETPATQIRTPRIRAGRQPLPEHLERDS